MTFTLSSKRTSIDLTRRESCQSRSICLVAACAGRAIVGSANAYMATTADVVPPSTTRAVGTLFSGFAPGENVNYFLNGTLAATFAADADGRVGVFLNSGTGQGFIAVDGIGQTSGKRAGGVLEALNTAPSSPGLAMAPHAFGANGSRTFSFMGTRHQASTTINIAVDGLVYLLSPPMLTARSLAARTRGGSRCPACVHSVHCDCRLNGWSEPGIPRRCRRR